MIAYKDANLERNTVASLRLEYKAEAGAENDDFTNTWSMSSDDGNGNQKEIASTVETDVYERTLEGTVWLDGVEPDHDGKIGKDKDGNDETKLAGVKVTLLRKNENGEYVEYTAYKETVDGKEYQCPSTLYTDENGHYKFTGLPEGEYRVKLESSDGVSLGGYDVTKYNEGSTEESSKVEKDNTEKTTDDQLTSATIVNIKMPTLEEMVSEGRKSYNLPDQNLGLIVPTVKIEVSKWWDDSDNQDGVRPDSVKITLYADGVKTEKSLVLTADTGWKGAFNGLAKFKADEKNNLKKITYSIQEENVDKYTAAITADNENPNRYIVQNSYSPETISITGTKTWIDGGNADETRPGSITVHLMADKKEISSQTVTAADNWSWIFENLPKYKNGKLITYKVKEDSVEGYVTEYSDESYDITNTYVITIHGTKTWDDAENQDGKRPEEIVIRLWKGVDSTSSETGTSGKEEIAHKTVTASDNWSWTFDNLPKYENGKEVIYTVTEDEVKDYTTVVDGYNVTNTHKPLTVEVPVTKVWKDYDNEDRIRPAEIVIHLYADDEDTEKTLKLSEENKWTGKFENLDKYKNGKKISYTVREDKVSGYQCTITGDAAEGYFVTNSHTPTPNYPSDPDPKPTATPIPTATPTPSATPEPSTTPTPSATPEPSATPIPSTTPTPSTTPVPSTSPEPSITPNPSETPEPSVTPPAEETPTPTPEPETGSITVTKSLKTNGKLIAAENQEFYVALFGDKECTQRVSEVKALSFQMLSDVSVSFDNLEPGKTYYVGETDEEGNLIESGVLDSGTLYVADFMNGNELTVDGDGQIEFDNDFEDFPDGFYYIGNLKVTKNLLGADGQAKNSDQTFYAGIFSDPEFTILSEDVEANVIELDLNGNSSASGEVMVYMASEDTVVNLYVTEVDENGTPVKGSAGFAYTMQVENGTVTIDKDHTEASVVITNQEKETPTPTPETKDPTPTPKENTPTPETDEPSTPQNGNPSSPTGGSDGGTSYVTPVKTGDETPVAWMLFLFAASAGLITVVTQKRRKKSRQK